MTAGSVATAPLSPNLPMMDPPPSTAATDGRYRCVRLALFGQFLLGLTIVALSSFDPGDFYDEDDSEDDRRGGCQFRALISLGSAVAILGLSGLIATIVPLPGSRARGRRRRQLPIPRSPGGAEQAEAEASSSPEEGDVGEGGDASDVGRRGGGAPPGEEGG